jgi:hypothetical protein
MDFIIDIDLSKGYDQFSVIINRFTTIAILIPLRSQLQMIMILRMFLPQKYIKSMPSQLIEYLIKILDSYEKARRLSKLASV